RTKVLTQGQLTIESGWHKLSFAVIGGNVTGFLDSKEVFNIATASIPLHGWVAIGTDGFGYADFDNLIIDAIQNLKN
ncbi:hypothetical protein RRG08_022328, partial [Elysia crispata]